MGNYYQPEIETMPVEKLAGFTERKACRAGKVCI